MFRRIANVRSFGVFNNFTGGTLPEFAPFNLIYGWNYSGKTTLSRVFRCLENVSHHPDYPTASFGFSHTDGTTYDHNFGSSCNVRVFNEDFRKEHLQWDDADGMNPILLLGAENIGRSKDLKAKEREREQLELKRTAAIQELKRFNDIIAKAETDCATQIVNELPVGRFNKTNLRPIIEAWNGVLPDALDDTRFKAERDKVTAEQKDILPDLAVYANPIEEVWREATALLDEQIGSTSTIERLVNNPEVGSWVEKGRHIHTGKTHCEFCEGPLTTERIAELNAHFSDAFENLKARIAGAIESASSLKLNFSGGPYARLAFYADLQPEQASAGKELGEARDEFNGSLQQVIDALVRKQANPFEIAASLGVVPQLAPLSQSLARFQKFIDRNNERTRLFDSARNAAIKTLKNYYAAEAMRKIDRFSLVDKINSQELLEQEAAQKLANLNDEIAALQAELSNATKGAEAINDTLQRFFGKADLQVKVTPKDKFLLMRGTELARNLSEGERTAIAFCYFMMKLFENGNDLSQTIIYIDDPISSLDSQHLLYVNAFIKNTFYKFDRTANPKHSCCAKQLFVSTHSYEFFHLTWEWMSDKKPNGFAAAYMIERTDSNGLVSSRIIECPKSIKQYKSEYLFLWHQLVGYQDAPSSDPQVIFNLGNMARRFIEGYLAFKFLEYGKIDSTLPLLIADPIHRERARKFMHFYSHTLTRAGGMRLPDMSEATAVVGLILDAVRTHDPVHYNALEVTR